MEYLVLDLARILRKSGIAVSTQEINDCLQILQMTGERSWDKYTFYNLINATMIKTEWGAAYVQGLAELFLEPDREYQQFLAVQTAKATGEGLGTGAKGFPLELLLEAVRKNDAHMIYALFKGLNLSLSLHEEASEKALVDFQERSGWAKISLRIAEDYDRGRLGPEDYTAALAALREWNELLKDEIERQFALNMSREHLAKVMQKQNPLTMDFLETDTSNVSEMSREITKLGRKLAVRKGRRRKPASKGDVDLSRSLRQAGKTGGIVLELFRTRNKPSKPDLWLLCDMSNSVSRFSYFMLMFVYTTQRRFDKIRSFIFVDRLLEVSDIFKNEDWSDSLSKLRRTKGCNLTGYTHYGNVLQQFAEEHLTSLHKKTTVLILGDAKNNWNTQDGSAELEKIRESAAAVYWLNPLPESLWNREDCIMDKYREVCSGVYACSNLEQLERFVSRVL